MSKRIQAAVLALIIAGGFAAAPSAFAQPAPATAEPHLAVAEPVHDLGTVAKGEKVDWTFTLRNTGSADLAITGARPGCGCTVVEFDKLIRPGQTGKVTAHLDTAAFSGPIAKAVAVETNDPDSPAIQLTLRAVVKPYVEAYPAGFIRVNLLQGDTDKQATTLYSEEAEPFDIVSIDSPVDWIKVEKHRLKPAEAVAGAGRAGQAQYRLEITVGGPDATVGPVAERIRIRTNSRHQPEYLFNVSGVIRPPYRFDPRSINFGEVAPTDTAAMRAVVIRSNNLKAPETFMVTGASANVPGLKVEVRQAANKGEFEVDLRVTSAMKPGSFAGEVRIETNDPNAPVATVPVKGVVKP